MTNYDYISIGLLGVLALIFIRAGYINFKEHAKQ